MIFGSVGRGGKNDARDVELVQHLLNQNQYRVQSAPCLVVNGVAGLETIQAIEAFQREVLLFPKPDGRVDPHQKTIRALSEKPNLPPPAAAEDEVVGIIETGVLAANHQAMVLETARSQFNSIPALVLDMRTLGKLLGDFGMYGNFRAVVSPATGRQYIVFNGYPGLRTIFRGTRYSINHPQIYGMGLSKLGRAASVVKSSFITLVTYSVIDAPEVLFEYRDRTLGELGVRFGSDLTKMGLGALATLAAAGAAAATGVVCAPVVAGIVAGIAVGVALDSLDRQLRLTERLEKYVADQQKQFERGAARHYRNFEQGFYQWLCSHGACVPYY